MGELVGVSDAARSHLVFVGASGSGKSVWLGRAGVYGDVLRSPPRLVILCDPVGATTDHLVDEILRLPPQQRQALGERILYVDMAGTDDRVVEMPLLYRVGHEPLQEVAARPLEQFLRSDSSLQNAPILGHAAVTDVGEAVGMALFALGGEQLDQAPALLRRLDAAKERLLALKASCPEVAPAVDYLLQTYAPLRPDQRRKEAMAFLRKVAPLERNPRLRARYAAKRRAIDWEKAARLGWIVIFDFRHVHRRDEKRFGLVHVFADVREYIQRRQVGQLPKMSLWLDELTFMFGVGDRQNPLEEDFEEMLARTGRNKQVNLGLAVQELNLLSERMLAILMLCPTQLYGALSDPAMAERVARRFVEYQPNLVRKTEVEPVYMNSPVGAYAIDTRVRTTEYTIPEQIHLFSRELLRLPAYTVLAGIPPRLGQYPTRLQLVTTRADPARVAIDRARVDAALAFLRQRSGRPVDEILAELDRREGEEWSGTARVRDGSGAAHQAPAQLPAAQPPRRSASLRREPV